MRLMLFRQVLHLRCAAIYGGVTWTCRSRTVQGQSDGNGICTDFLVVAARYLLFVFVCVVLVGWLVGRSVGRSVGRFVGWLLFGCCCFSLVPVWDRLGELNWQYFGKRGGTEALNPTCKLSLLRCMDVQIWQHADWSHGGNVLINGTSSFAQ